MGVLVPALGLARRKAESLRCMNHLKQIAAQANLYAMDHGDKYPESVATIGRTYAAKHWNWYDPRNLLSIRSRTTASHRSMSAYLREYVENAELLCCPGAPDSPKYVQEMWDAGDDWDDPERPGPERVTGHYAFYWNYEGLLNLDGTSQPRRLFRGPKGPASSGRYSKLLVTDYFGYGSLLDNAPPNSYASCESFEGGSSKSASDIFPHWSKTAGNESFPDVSMFPRVTLRAAFTDEHVEVYTSAQTAPLWVILDRKSLDVYEPGHGPGLFYLPETALPSTR